MHCPFCRALDTKVIDSRLVDDGASVRRRRECSHCSERFNTYELVERIMPRVVKRDGTRVAYDSDKLRGGILKALEKRPIEADKVDAAVARIERDLQAASEREVDSQYIGELVMNQLKELDQVAYVRFASVYRSFQDVKAFNDVISGLEKPFAKDDAS